MNNKNALYGLVIAGAVTGTQAVYAADPASMSIGDISGCMRANIVDRGSLRDFEVKSTDREGKTSTIKVKVFWKPAKGGPEERMTMQVVEPEAYAGTSYLLISKPGTQDVHLYLPALNRVQVMSGGDMSQPLWGTDFTFAEIKQVQGMLQDGETTRLADATVFDRQAFLLDTVTSLEQTGYTHVKSYVDQQTCTLLKTELFTDGDAPRKVLEAGISSLIEVEPYWLMLGYRMENRTAGTRTDLKLSDVFLLELLPEALFTPEGFHTPQE